jgi:hypothetical protein
MQLLGFSFQIFVVMGTTIFGAFGREKGKEFEVMAVLALSYKSMQC